MRTKQQSRDYWQKFVTEFESGKHDQRAFCKKRGLQQGTFQKWLYKLRDRSKGPQLVRVTTAPQSESDVGGQLEVQTPDGFVLRFGADVDAEYVAEVVAALGG